MSFWWLLRWLVVLVAGCTAMVYQALTGHQVWAVDGAGSDLPARLLAEGLLDVLDHSGPSRTVRVSPQTAQEVKTALQEAAIPYRVLIHDLAAYIKKASEGGRENRSPVDTCTATTCPAPLYTRYMTLSQMEWYLKEMNRTFPSRIRVSSIGKTVEGRDIWLVHLPAANTSGRAIWVEAGLHAREWISPAVALHLINHTINNRSATANMDIFVVPMANPDGYVYTWTTNRFWRKNRRINAGTTCAGVDLNRNWDYHFGVGASTNPCSEVYKGPSVFSEPETQALRNAMLKQKDNLKLVLSLHSFGQDLLYPWGWSGSVKAPGTHQLIEMGQVFTQAIKNATGTKYAVKNSAEGLYLASGATDDWAIAVLKTKYAYTLELRDLGQQGFLLGPNNILPCSEEVWHGLTQVIKHIK